jgi:Universal stress protein family
MAGLNPGTWNPEGMEGRLTGSGGGPGRIVVGVDGSECSKRALRWAARQAELTGAILDVIAASQFPVFYGWTSADLAERQLTGRPPVARTTHQEDAGTEAADSGQPGPVTPGPGCARSIRSLPRQLPPVGAAHRSPECAWRAVSAGGSAPAPVLARPRPG